MPYVLVSTQVRLTEGPCCVGDEHSNPTLMGSLDAKLVKKIGNNFKEWVSDIPPRHVLNRLERQGYTLAGMTGAGQTCIWTMYKPAVEGQEDEPGLLTPLEQHQQSNGVLTSTGPRC